MGLRVHLRTQSRQVQDKRPLDDNYDHNDGKSDDEEGQTSKIPKRSLRGHASTKAKVPGKSEPKLPPVKEDSNHMSDSDLFALAGLHTMKKTPAKSKSDLPPFLFSAEGDESGSAGNNDNAYDQLCQIFNVKVKRIHTILKKQLKM